MDSLLIILLDSALHNKQLPFYFSYSFHMLYRQLKSPQPLHYWHIIRIHESKVSELCGIDGQIMISGFFLLAGSAVSKVPV